MTNKPKTNKWVDTFVDFIMDTANGIDDYNWGQDQFEAETRQRLLNLITQTQQETLDWVLDVAIKDADRTFDGIVTVEEILDKATLVETIKQRMGGNK